MLDRGLTKYIDEILGRELRGKLNESLLLILLIKNYNEALKDKDVKITGFRGKRKRVTEGLTTREIADSLNMAQSTISTAVSRLVKKGYLTHSKGLPVKTTELGRQVANERLRHHRLLEVFLAECLGFDADSAHNESVKLMLLTSCAVIEAIDKRFNHPKMCPCGEPIPESDLCEKEINHDAVI